MFDARVTQLEAALAQLDDDVVLALVIRWARAHGQLDTLAQLADEESEADAADEGDE